MALRLYSFFGHATPSHYHHNARLLTQTLDIYLEKLVNACWLHSVESVSKVFLILVIIFFIFAIHSIICVQLTVSSIGDREDIFVTRLIIIIKWELSTFPIVIFFLVAVRWLYHQILSVVPLLLCRYSGTLRHVQIYLYALNINNACQVCSAKGVSQIQ